ncbi:unnamed protein product [Phytophthora fragariaefolia]|uniref:fumarate reductase (NADH) n=1 Tax=Phytophthora fragariaefolia TaxID=1490495 RepID=A0A9W7D509_9STRA|nr:unnamed protein product [Phytophthora fragariaefolia]
MLTSTWRLRCRVPPLARLCSARGAARAAQPQPRVLSVPVPTAHHGRQRPGLVNVSEPAAVRGHGEARGPHDHRSRTRRCVAKEKLAVGAGKLTQWGAWTAGLTASLEAANLDPSLKILLVEKEKKVGGNSAKASSGINAALDAADEPLFTQDTLKSGGGLAVEKITPGAKEFLEGYNVDLSVLSQLGGHSAKRTHRNKSGPNIGFAIISTLQKEIATRSNIEILTGATAKKLLLADDTQSPPTVTGVELKLADEQTLSVFSKAVILTTGGFSASHTMLKRFAPGMEVYPTTNGVWAQGEGVLMSEAIGVDLTLMDKVQLHPTGFINPKDREAGTRFLAPEAIRGSGALLLNKNGKRFVDELTTRDKASAAMLAQPGQEAYMLLFEDGAKAMASELPFYKHMGIVTMTESVADAAKFCSFADPQSLLKELNDYAEIAAGAKEDPFGKKTFPYPIQRIPSIDTPIQIAAMEVAPTVHYTMGDVLLEGDIAGVIVLAREAINVQSALLRSFDCHLNRFLAFVETSPDVGFRRVFIAGMDSTAVCSRNARDSESWSSSEGEEQVIEISSHSRILISPRRSWSEKSQRSRRRSTDKKKSSRTRQDAIGSPHSQQSCRSTQVKSLVKGYWPGSPRKIASDNQPRTSNNHADTWKSGDSSEDSSSGHESDELSSVSSSSLEDVEAPVRRRISRMKHPARVEKVSKSTYKSLNDSMQSLDSPTTPGKEMEELKATLKKLARHDDSDENPILQKPPDISSATALHEYLTAATALGGINVVAAAEQTHPTQSPELMKTRQASFHPPRQSPFMLTGSSKARSKSMHKPTDEFNVNRAPPTNGTQGNPVKAEYERLSFNKKLFSTPPPPFGGPGKYAPGLAFPTPADRNANTGSGGIGGGAQGSRAVLSALKALQDKIGRLEEERENLKEELADAKISARKRKAELTSSEKKFSYELGQMKDSARAAYDALRCDREELKLQLVKSEERRKATQIELQHFQELTKTFSAKADDLQAQLQISESHRTRLKAEMKESESEHKRIVSELQKELTQVQQECQVAVERNELLEDQFQRESNNHTASRERLKDSEQTVASISQLNEKLVAKVMEATEAASQAMKKNKKLQQQIRPSTLLRPTAASRASAAAATEAQAKRVGSSTASQSNTGLVPARTAKKKKTITGATASAMKKPKKTKAVNNMTLLREANLGKEIPFLLGNSVQPSFSLIGNAQDALRRSDTTYMMPTLLSEGSTVTPRSTRSHLSSKTHQQPIKSSHNAGPSDEEDTENAQQQPSPTAGESTTAALVSPTPTPKASARGHRRSTKHEPPAINVSAASPKSYVSPMQVSQKSFAI